MQWKTIVKSALKICVKTFLKQSEWINFAQIVTESLNISLNFLRFKLTERITTQINDKFKDLTKLRPFFNQLGYRIYFSKYSFKVLQYKEVTILSK